MPYFKRKYQAGTQIKRAYAQSYTDSKKLNDDAKNRRYVMKKIIAYINSGLSEEEALQKIMEDEVANHFDYLEKNGLDKKQCFRNWIKNKNIQPKNKIRDEQIEK